MDRQEFARKNHEGLNSNPDFLNYLDNLLPKKDVFGQTAEDVKTMNEQGFVIIKNLLTPEYLSELREALKPHLGPRIAGLTTSPCIRASPGEKRQPFHYDDQFMNIARPHRPFSIATIWAIDDFTAENGGTVVIPGSHTWGHLPTREDIEQRGISVEMPAGSVVVFVSTLWHGGGANVTANQWRCAVSAQYCEPWVRPQENMQMVVPMETVDELHPTLQSMIGYSIHPPFIGHVNGLHPTKTLEARLQRYGLLRAPHTPGRTIVSSTPTATLRAKL